MPNINKAVPGAKEFYPLNEPGVGATLPSSQNIPPLFQPLTIRDVTFHNRVFVSPMCQYSSVEGDATDWHFVHYGGFATRGVGAICMEATAVVPEGRISPEDAGLWADSQIAPLKRIVDFAHSQGTKIGVQLAHAGRKSSTLAPWAYYQALRDQKPVSWAASEDERGWPDKVFGPSELSYAQEYHTPHAMTEDDMIYVEDAFVAAVKRCEEVGFDFIELHGAHGYLLNQFVSPLSNVRTDSYGGSLENRMRWPLRVVERCREAWGQKPLFYRIGATDWAEGLEKAEDGTWIQWGIEQTKVLVGELQKLGVDFVDVSTGGNWAAQNIPVGPNYQVPFAAEIKKEYPNMPIGAVGLIETSSQANAIVEANEADVVSLARAFIRNPHWAMQAAHDLGVAVKRAQYEAGWMFMRKI
ncbi:NADH:flavin oxidoreductase 2 [Stereum hirsutum FP-91666 SS1]|uniref:NADH:flavin oxidoreductase 2 n=1 Tax=Stereum hirsutum (strain FP-91666) TaxID=721885 RepID=R7RYL0_STEHR|nr:NADH:flavin oxidoreductase 2 [Stereum hirsutum FP-91666 SS1]EIM80496.1 NADH:flavin oxidoreductase 2 [Stereum hirsutum FP-91666 SS1]